MTPANARGPGQAKLLWYMRRLAISAAVAALVSAATAAADPQIDSAVRALRKDSSLKVRTQAAIVLGQRGAKEAVPALLEAVAEDGAAAVRLAAVGALAKIGDRSVRPTLEEASRSDRDAAVRKAAERALRELGPASFSIEEPAGSAGGSAARSALRSAIAKHLQDRGFEIVERGGLRLKPTLLRVEVDARGGRTVIAVKASLMAVEADGRMAAMLESGAKLSANGKIPDAKIPTYSAKAIDAAARTLCDDLAAKLGER